MASIDSASSTRRDPHPPKAHIQKYVTEGDEVSNAVIGVLDIEVRYEVVVLCNKLPT